MSAQKRAPEKRLRAFRGNSFDDYFDTGMRNFPLPARVFLGIAVYACLVWTQFRWRWSVENKEKLVDDKTPRVIVMNHGSMLDPVIIIVQLWLHGIRVRTIYKSEFDKSPVVTWFFTRVGAIPVQRGTADMKSVRRARAALDRGECVLIFPEGTRSVSGRTGRFHLGAFYTAQQLQLPLVPLHLAGTGHVLPPHRLLLRPAPMTLAVGRALTPPAPDDSRAVRRLRHWLHRWYVAKEDGEAQP